jgi:hypothetical protein
MLCMLHAPGSGIVGKKKQMQKLGPVVVIGSTAGSEKLFWGLLTRNGQAGRRMSLLSALVISVFQVPYPRIPKQSG